MNNLKLVDSAVKNLTKYWSTSMLGDFLHHPDAFPFTLLLSSFHGFLGYAPVPQYMLYYKPNVNYVSLKYRRLINKNE